MILVHCTVCSILRINKIPEEIFLQTLTFFRLSVRKIFDNLFNEMITVPEVHIQSRGLDDMPICVNSTRTDRPGDISSHATIYHCYTSSHIRYVQGFNVHQGKKWTTCRMCLDIHLFYLAPKWHGHLTARPHYGTSTLRHVHLTAPPPYGMSTVWDIHLCKKQYLVSHDQQRLSTHGSLCPNTQ
jgi:hypothetical protein